MIYTWKKVLITNGGFSCVRMLKLAVSVLSKNEDQLVSIRFIVSISCINSSVLAVAS